MPKDSSSVRIERILGLIEEFVTREKVRKVDLESEFGYKSRKTLQRDLDLLRTSQGFDITYNRKGDFYQLQGCDSNFVVRYPLSEDEVLVLLVGMGLAGHFLPFLKEPANILQTKLKKILPSQSRPKGESLAKATILAYPMSKMDKDVFKKVVEAIHSEKVLKLQYRSPYEERPVDRVHRLSPWFIYFKHRAWYVWGKSDQYEKSGSFRISRFRYAEILQGAVYEKPEEGVSLESFVHCEDPFCTKTYTLKLIIHEPFATSVKEVDDWYPEQEIRRNEDGSILFSAKVGNLEEVGRWVLASADCVEILEPAELKHIVREKASRLLASLKRKDPEPQRFFLSDDSAQSEAQGRQGN
ncbi:MAG: helix-turn-helix transcriptional regulator [Thermovirgaceae bacterium]